MAGDRTAAAPQGGIVNLHATAIVIGTCGLLITGPSGAGKSRLALALVGEAHARGWFGRIVADDRVLIERTASGMPVARAPETIFGMVEARGSGILTLASISRAVLHHAVVPAAPTGEDRVPPPGEHFDCGGGLWLPATRLLYQPDPASFATLASILRLNR